MKHPVYTFLAFNNVLTILILCSNVLIRIVAAQQTCDRLYASAGMDQILSFQIQVPSNGVFLYQVGHPASHTNVFEIIYINGNATNPIIINWCEYGPDVDLAAGKLDLKLLEVTSNRTGTYELKNILTSEVIQCIDVILLDASGLPSIQGFANNSIYYMIRNTSQTLTCSVKGGRPQPQLTWSCYNGHVGGFVEDGDTFTSSISWTSVGLESTCSCTLNQVLAGSTSTVLFIKLLYSPDTPTLTMGSKQVSLVYLTEEESFTVACNSISSPAPSRYTWLLPNGQTTVGQQLHIDSVQYHVNPVYTCIVENRMIPSQGAEVAGSSSAYLPVILFYSPRHINNDQSKEEVKAVPGTKTDLGVTLVAFPLPSVYFWTRCMVDVCSVIHNDTNMFTSTFGLASTLTIMSTRQEDFGQYKLTVSNGIGHPYNYTFFLREIVSANNQVSTETNTALIVGVVGGVVVVALIVNAVVIVLCLVRRKSGGGMETTSYQRSKKQTQYDDVQEQTPAGQNDSHRNSGAEATATSTSQSEYIGLSQYGNVQNPYEELGAGIDMQTRPEKTYTNVSS